MASRVQFMRVCWQRGETAPRGKAGASGETGRGGEGGRPGEGGQGRETGGRCEAGACGGPRSISSSRASAREGRCAARADARERATLGGSRSQAFALNAIAHPRRDACAARKPR